MTVVCTSCGRETNDYNAFPCPNNECKSQVIRCKACRENSVKWGCRSCGQSGP